MAMMGIIKKHAHRRLALAGSFSKCSLAISVSRVFFKKLISD